MPQCGAFLCYDLKKCCANYEFTAIIRQLSFQGEKKLEMKGKKDNRIRDEQLARIRSDILTIFEQAITDDSTFFDNPHVSKCWELQNCDRKLCC